MCSENHDVLCVLPKSGDIMCIWCEMVWKATTPVYYNNHADPEHVLMRITKNDIRCQLTNKQWHKKPGLINEFKLQPRSVPLEGRK